MSLQQTCEFISYLIPKIRSVSNKFNLIIKDDINYDLLSSIVKLGLAYKISVNNTYDKLGLNDLEIYNNSIVILKLFHDILRFDIIDEKLTYKYKYTEDYYMKCLCYESMNIVNNVNTSCDSCLLVNTNICVYESFTRVKKVKINDIEYKYCKTCKAWKILSLFSKKGNNSRKHICKNCDRMIGAKYRFNNYELEKLRHYIYDNSEHGKSIHSKYYYNHHEKLRADQAIYNEEHKEEIKLQQREAYAEDPEKFKERQRLYRENPVNKGLIRLTKKFNIRNKRQSDPVFKLMDGLRTHFYIMLNGNMKVDSVRKLIGCTKEELLDKLEEKFQPGMTRENRGNNGWHVDHIISCALYNFNSEEEQKCCYHYSNLQPLWARDNMAKGKKLSRETYLEHRLRLCRSIKTRLDEMFEYYDDVTILEDDEGN